MKESQQKQLQQQPPQSTNNTSRAQYTNAILLQNQIPTDKSQVQLSTQKDESKNFSLIQQQSQRPQQVQSGQNKIDLERDINAKESEEKKNQNPIITLYQVGFHSHRPTVSHDLTSIIKQLDFSDPKVKANNQIASSKYLHPDTNDLQINSQRDSNQLVSQIECKDQGKNKQCAINQKRLFYQSYNESIFKDVQQNAAIGEREPKEMSSNKLLSIEAFFKKDEHRSQQDQDILRISSDKLSENQSNRLQSQYSPSGGGIKNNQQIFAPSNLQPQKISGSSKTPISSLMFKQESVKLSTLNAANHKTPNAHTQKQPLIQQRQDVFSEHYYNQNHSAKVNLKLNSNGVILNNNLAKLAQQSSENKIVQSPLIIHTSKLGLQNDRKKSLDFVLDNIKLLQNTSNSNHYQNQNQGSNLIQHFGEEGNLFKSMDDSVNLQGSKDQLKIFSPHKLSLQTSAFISSNINESDAEQALKCRMLLIKKGKRLGRTVFRWAQLTKQGKLIYYSQPHTQDAQGIYTLYQSLTERSQVQLTIEIQKAISSMSGGHSLLIEPFALDQSKDQSAGKAKLTSISPLNLNQQIECFQFKKANSDEGMFQIILNEKDQLFFRQPAMDVFQELFKLSSQGLLQEFFHRFKHPLKQQAINTTSILANSQAMQIFQESQMSQIKPLKTQVEELKTINSQDNYTQNNEALSPDNRLRLN